MSPIRSFLCHDCMYEFDELRRHDDPPFTDCPRCDAENGARTIPSAPSTPRGNFGTTARRPRDNVQKLNFPPKKDTE